MVDVFISYPRLERAKAELIKNKLDVLGLELFFDIQGIDGGDTFPDVIDRAVKSAKAVLGCWTPRAFQSKWCMIECRVGDARGVLVPVALERFDEMAVPAQFMATNYLDLTDFDGVEPHEGWSRTLRALSRHIGRQLAPQGTIDAAAPPWSAASSGPQRSASALAWALIKDSLDLADYVEFQTHFPGTPEVLLAGRQRRQLEAWAAVSKRDGHAIAAFAQRSLFPALAREAAEAMAKTQAAPAPRTGIAGAKTAEEVALEAIAEALNIGQPDGAEVARALRLKPGAIWRDAIDGLPQSAVPEMVTIPTGRFLMGSPATEERGPNYDGREEPQHEVVITRPFALGRFAVTFAEWDAAIAAGAKLATPNDNGWGRGRRPVVNVNWTDAQAYIDWLKDVAGLSQDDYGLFSYRLPSEAEWEYACRAGAKTPFTFGATITSLQANYNGRQAYGDGKKGEHRKRTTPVGSFTANAFGVHDMHGNAWEWCNDCWNPNYTDAPTNGSAWKTGDCARRIVRGGSFDSDPHLLRSGYRLNYHEKTRYGFVGFRLARTLPVA